MRNPRLVLNLAQDNGSAVGKNPSCWPVGGVFDLDRRDFHHLKHVLRLSPEREIEAFDPKLQRGFLCKLISLEPEKSQVIVLRELPLINTGRIVLIPAIIKPQYCDLIVRNCVEVGVSEIHFFKADRSSQRISSSQELGRRLSRLENVSQAALKQSGFHGTPQIAMHQNLKSVLDKVHPGRSRQISSSIDLSDSRREWRLVFVAPPNFTCAIDLITASQLFKSNAETATLTPQSAAKEARASSVGSQVSKNSNIFEVCGDSYRNVEQSLENPTQTADSYIIIGAEGGFSEEELDLAETFGYWQVTLGPKVLRAETAATVACAMVGLLGSAR